MLVWLLVLGVLALLVWIVCAAAAPQTPEDRQREDALQAQAVDDWHHMRNERKRTVPKKNWIASAVSHPGALSRKADKAGQTPMQFARAHQDDSGKTGQQARLALTLAKVRPSSGGGKGKSHK